MAPNIRKCCVMSCESSSLQKNRSLFQIPRKQEYEAHRKWLNALENKIKNRKASSTYLYVCNLHFTKNCLVENDYTILKDGVEMKVERKRKRLKCGSIPSIFDVNIEPSSSSVVHVPLIELPENFSQPSELTRSNESGTLSCILQQGPVLEKTVERSDSMNATMNLESLTFENTSLLPVTLVEPQDFNTLNIKNLEKHSIVQCDDVSENCIQSAVPNISVLTEGYSLATLRANWKSMPFDELANSWAIADTKLGVIFAYCGDTFRSATRTILVKHDMSVEVRAQGRIPTLELPKKILCIKDFLVTLQTISCMNVCPGNDECSMCPNVLFMRKSRAKSERCPECTMKRKRKRDILRKREKRSLLKNQKDKKMVKNVKQKQRRYKAKLLNIEQAMHEFKNSI